MNPINYFKTFVCTALLSVMVNQAIYAQKSISAHSGFTQNVINTLNSTEADAIDHIFEAWTIPNTPGCGLGIIKDGALVYAKGYGLANMEYNIPNSINSVFRIGSTSKQFTAASIILLAEQGKLDLNNTLNEYFPEFPEYSKKITLRHLLNHTSGIRDYLTLTYLKGYSNFDYYTDADIMRWLINQTDLNFEPGDEFTYSNSGYWLLGQIVNQVAGKNMSEFSKDEIFEPLGMENTHFHNNHNDIVKHRASGYFPTGKDSYEIDMTTLDMIGDGGIFTTINDIKKWDDAYYNSSVLSKSFWGMMTKQGVLNNGESIDYASGLFIETYKGLKNINHGGAFAGFRAELMRFPDQHLTIAIFANRGDANPTKQAYKIADILLKDEFQIEKNKVSIPENSSKNDDALFTITQIEGLYEIEPGAELTLSAKEDILVVKQSWNNAEFKIERTTGNVFHVPTIEGIKFRFSDLKEDKIQKMIVYQGGQETSCKRIRANDLSTLNLSDYIGQYYSKELDAVYTIKQNNDELEVTIRNNPAFTINASNIDLFSFYGNQVRFKRKNQKISGFELDAGRVTGLKFEKQ